MRRAEGRSVPLCPSMPRRSAWCRRTPVALGRCTHSSKAPRLFHGSHLSRALGIERATQVAHRRRWIESSAGPRRVPCSACWPLAAPSRRGAAEVLGFGWRRPGRAHGREDLLGQLGDGAGGAVGGAGGQRAVPYGGGDVGTEVESARAQRRRERACPSHPCTPCTHTVLHTPRTRRLSRRCLRACRGGSNPGF